MCYIPYCKQYLRTIIYYTQILYTLIWSLVVLLSESHAIINDLDVIVHGFMLQIIYTTVLRVKWIRNLTPRVRLFNHLTGKTGYKYCVSMMRTSLQTIHSVEGDTGGSMKELLDSHWQKWYIRDHFQKFVFNWSTTTTSNAIEAAIKFSVTCRDVTFSMH